VYNQRAHTVSTVVLLLVGKLIRRNGGIRANSTGAIFPPSAPSLRQLLFYVAIQEPGTYSACIHK
jgi:hypothetical protein